MQKAKISLVIPAYNEAAIIKNTINEALELLAGTGCDYELIISDDGSTDETRLIAQSVNDEHLRVIGHFPNKGKGCAVREGMLAAEGDVVISTDADLAYGIDAVGELASRLQNAGTDIAVGSRKLHPEGYEDYPFIRLLASRLFSLMTGLLAASATIHSAA